VRTAPLPVRAPSMSVAQPRRFSGPLDRHVPRVTVEPHAATLSAAAPSPPEAAGPEYKPSAIPRRLSSTRLDDRDRREQIAWVKSGLGEAPSPRCRRCSASCKQRGKRASTMTQWVRITVRGRLSTRLASAFAGMAPRHRRGHTELVGEIADQAQLHGLLSRIRDLGLELENVSVLPKPDNKASARHRPRKGD
jgi:hypothetical protein